MSAVPNIMQLNAPTPVSIQPFDYAGGLAKVGMGADYALNARQMQINQQADQTIAQYIAKNGLPQDMQGMQKAMSDLGGMGVPASKIMSAADSFLKTQSQSIGNAYARNKLGLLNNFLQGPPSSPTPGQSSSPTGMNPGATVSAPDSPQPPVASAMPQSPSTDVQRYSPMTSYWEKYYGLPPGILSAIMPGESWGDPGAVNPHSGATGLMQVMPENNGMFAPGESPTDPNANIHVGAQILANALKQTGGDLPAALKIYGGYVHKDPTSYINGVMSQMPTGSGGAPEVNGQIPSGRTTVAAPGAGPMPPPEGVQAAPVPGQPGVQSNGAPQIAIPPMPPGLAQLDPTGILSRYNSPQGAALLAFDPDLAKAVTDRLELVKVDNPQLAPQIAAYQSALEANIELKKNQAQQNINLQEKQKELQLSNNQKIFETNYTQLQPTAERHMVLGQMLEKAESGGIDVPYRTILGNIVSAFKNVIPIDDDSKQRLINGAASAEDLKKLSSQNTMDSIKQTMGSSRLNETIADLINHANPNETMNPTTLRTVLGQVMDVNNRAFDSQARAVKSFMPDDPRQSAYYNGELQNWSNIRDQANNLRKSSAPPPATGSRPPLSSFERSN